MSDKRKRIWGWYFFDWAQQPYATLGLTFIFAPYFASVAAGAFEAAGSAASRAEAQSLWSSAQTIAGLVIAFSAPFLGAYADASGRKTPWFVLFIATAVICSAGLWVLEPDGTNLYLALILFWVGFVASESSFNLNNAILPTLGDPEEAGRISGGATAFGYWGGVLSLFVVLLFFAENDTGTTLLGLDPIFGLSGEDREGTRFVGPFIAIWFAVFSVPFFLWIRDARERPPPPSFGMILSRLGSSLKRVVTRRSFGSFLLASMFYRDALTALYAYGGIYATLVLDWSIVQIGVFGIVAAIAAAILSWVGGLADHRFGPKPVIRVTILVLIGVGCVIIGMSRESLFGVPLAPGSALPDIIFYVCGAAIGGAGGALYSASRSMMVRHCTTENAAEAFGLFALTGRATAFLAPALITVSTQWTQSNQLGFLPVIFLFATGFLLLAWVKPEGDRAVTWSDTPEPA
ncbi:MAG: MFS transporter [Paracoccaceae bacterium]|nr:MFS transporter [Paracoccaceae bacterium]